MPAINSVRKTKIVVVGATFSKIRKTWSFYVVVWQRTATKCTKIYNARAQLLFCSLNLLFSNVPVAVAVVVCLSSLFCTTATDKGLPGILGISLKEREISLVRKLLQKDLRQWKQIIILRNSGEKVKFSRNQRSIYYPLCSLLVGGTH